MLNNLKIGSVSVVIPNFNRADIVGETIENMLSQSFRPHEVIVVDDGSTDLSLDVIRGFGNKVRLFQQSNKGPGAARNAGLRIASGEFIQFMDSDDLASLNKLEVQAMLLAKNNADIVYGPWVKIWKQSNIIRLENVVLQQAPLPASYSTLFWFLTEWSMVFQQCLVRRKLLLQVGGYPENLRSFEDGELFVKLLLAGGKIIHEAESLTFYRQDDYGKLTASGQQQFRRTTDEACFYCDLIGLSVNIPELLKCLQHKKFMAKVRNVLHELKDNDAMHTDHYKRLYNFAGKHNQIDNFQHWLNIKKGGVRHMLKGHRWPHCYKTGPLSNHQLDLIGQLGWELT